MSADFFLTQMGRRFYESDVPRIANALASIAKSLEESVAKQTPAVDPLREEVTKVVAELVTMGAHRPSNGYPSEHIVRELRKLLEETPG